MVLGTAAAPLSRGASGMSVILRATTPGGFVVFSSVTSHTWSVPCTPLAGSPLWLMFSAMTTNVSGRVSTMPLVVLVGKAKRGTRLGCGAVGFCRRKRFPDGAASVSSRSPFWRTAMFSIQVSLESNWKASLEASGNLALLFWHKTASRKERTQRLIKSLRSRIDEGGNAIFGLLRARG